MAYLDEIEPNLNHREDFYLAQVAFRLALNQTNKPDKLKIKDFLIKFTKDRGTDDIRERDDLTPAQKKALITKKSKAAWLGWLGLSG